MLEKYVAALLVPYLSKYVENIDATQLRIDIWSGKASLKDLILRPDALDALLDPPDTVGGESQGQSGSGSGTAASASPPVSGAAKPGRIPIRMTRGVCKNANLHIPLKRLRSEPVVLEIDEVLITVQSLDDARRLASSLSGTTSSVEVEAAGAQDKGAKWDVIAARKQRELEAFEAERRRQREAAVAVNSGEEAAPAEAGKQSTDDVGKDKQGGYFSRLAEVVVNNIIVKIHSVHIRYEDRSHRTVIGAILGDVQLLTVNEATGEATFIDPALTKKVCKRFVLSGLQLYCDAPSEVDANEKQNRCWLTALQSPTDWQEWYHLMRKRVRDGDLALSTIFGPVSGAVDVNIVLKSFMRRLLDTPYATVRARMDHVLARLTRDQYTTITRTVSRLVNPDKGQRLLGDVRRPRVPVKGHAREWWRYAQKAVLHLVREPRQARLLARVSEVCRMDYQVLYRDVVRQTEMSAEKKRTYRFITRFMTVPDMIAGRRDVYSQLALEMQRKRKDNQAKKAEAGAASGAGATAAGGAVTATATSAVAPPAPKKKGWFSGWFGGGGSSTDPTTATTAAVAKTPEEEEEEVFKNLERDYGITAEEAAQAGDLGVGSPTTETNVAAAMKADGLPPGRDTSLPANYTWVDLAMDLPYAKYSIDVGKGEGTALQFFHLHSRVQLFNYASSALFHVSVQNVCLSNSAPPEQSEGAALVRQLVEGVRVGHAGVSSSSPRVTSLINPDTTSTTSTADDSNKQGATANAPTLREILGIDGPTSQGSSRTSYSETSSSVEVLPLLDIAGVYQPVEQPLDDTKLDVALRVQLLPLRVVMDPHTIESVLRFFELPAGVDVSALTSSTMEAATAVGTKASQELKAAMGKAKGIYVSVDISAPILVLPTTLRGRRTEPALAMALGRIRFTSKPLTEAEKQKRLASGGESEEVLYYSSRARFGKFYMELTTLEDALRRPEKGFMLVPEVSIVADVLQLIDNTQTNRERVIVRLKVPALRVSLSLHQVYRLTHLIETWLQYTVSSYGTHEAGAGAAPHAPLRSQSDSLTNSFSFAEHTRGSQPLRLLGPNAAGMATTPGATGQAPNMVGPQRSASPFFTTNDDSPGDGVGGRRTSMSLSRAASNTVGSSNGNNNNTGNASTNTNVTGSPGGAPLPLPQVSAQPPQNTPVFRIELLVNSLGVDVFEDDAKTLKPAAVSRFAVTCADAEMIFAKQTLRSKLLVVVQQTFIVDTLDKTHPVLSSSSLRVDVGLSSGGPVAVGLLLENAGLTLRLGTPCMELLEVIMDMVNLVMSTIDCVSLMRATAAAGGQPLNGARSDDTSAGVYGADGWDEVNEPVARDKRGGAGSSGAAAPLNANSNATMGLPAVWRRSPTQAGNLALASSGYGLGSTLSNNSIGVMSGQGSASPRGGGGGGSGGSGDVRVANISIRIDGESRLELMSRHRGDQEDYLFASATICDVDIFLKKNRTTLELTGKVGRAEASLSDKSGLLPAHCRIIRHGNHGIAPHLRTASHAEAASDGTTSPFQPSTPTRRETQRPSASAAAPSGTTQDASRENFGTPSSTLGNGKPTPQVGFTYRTNAPVVPVFGVEDGKRVLRNAAELRYSSALELELGASTLCVDLQTVMLLKAYFTTGFFSRISRLGDRPLYNCRTLRPAQEPLQLLMSIRVVVTDVVLELPLDARGNATEYFGASIGHVAVQNNLLSSESQQSTTVSLREICLWRYGAQCARHGLLPSPTFIEVTIRTDLDVDSEEPTRVDVRSDDMSATINHDDLVDVATLIRQNLSRTQVDEADSAPPEEPTVRQYVGSPNSRHAPDDGTWGTDAGAGAVVPPAAAAAAAAATSDITKTPGPSAGGLHISVVHAAADAVSLGGTSAVSRADTMIGLRVGKLAVILEDGPAQPLFRLGAASIAMIASTPTNHFNVLWKSLDVSDLRPVGRMDEGRVSTGSAPMSDNASRTANTYTTLATTLLLCGEGHIQLANSLTTRNILMSDFGVRPSALTSVDTDAMESLTSSEVMTTLGGGAPAGASGAYTRKATTKPHQSSPLAGQRATSGGPPPRHSAHNRVDTATAPGRGLADDDDDDDYADDNAAGDDEPTKNIFAPSSSPTELLTVAVLSIKFSLRRFAISDQWLNLYDLVCNEAVVNAFSAAQTGAPAPVAAASPALTKDTISSVSPAATTTATATPATATAVTSSPSAGYHAASAGFRCTVSTSSVSIPFLTSSRRVLCEARLESLLVDVASLGNGSHVTTKVQGLELIDAKSGERILRRRPAFLINTGAGGGGGAPLSSGFGGDGFMDEAESPLTADYGSSYATQTGASMGSPTSPRGLSPAAGTSGGGGGFTAASMASIATAAASQANNATAATSTSPSPGAQSSASPQSGGQTSAIGGGGGDPSAGLGGPHLLPLSAQGSASNATHGNTTGAPNHANTISHLTSPPPPMTRFASTFSGHASPLESAAPAVAAPPANDVLHFSFKGDSVGHKNRIQLQIGQLDVLLSMPLIYGLLEYFTSPDQPIAKISSLGVMKEQRERVAAAAKQMANTSVIGFHVLWHQPRILCVTDGMDLTNWSTTGRSRALQVCLGVMKTTVVVNQALQQLSVTLRAQDFNIEEVMEKASLRLGFASSANNTQELHVELDKTVALLHPTELEHVMLVLRQNLMLPPTRRYYDDALPCPTPQPSVASSPSTATTTASATEAAAAGAPVSRTVLVSIRGLHLAVHDLMRMRTHTLTLADMHLTIAASGDVELIVPVISLQEHFTNRYLLYSGRSVAGLPSTTAAGTEKNALMMTVRHDTTTGATLTDVAVANTVVTVVPRGMGSLINILLSISLPEDPSSAGSDAAATQPQPQSPLSTTKTTTTAATPGASAAAGDAHGTSSTTKTARVLASGLTARLDACGVRIPAGDKDIAMIHLEVMSCEKNTYVDGSSDLHVVLGQLIMEDLMPRKTLYKNIIEPFVDESASEQDDQAAGATAPGMLGPTTAVDERNFVNLSVHTVAKVRDADAAAAAPLFGTQVTCRVGHLCFTCVPDLVHSVMSVVTEVSNNMSEHNRGRAAGYMSETANASIQAVSRNLDTSSSTTTTTDASATTKRSGAKTTAAASETPKTAAAAAASVPGEDVALSFVKLDVVVRRPQLRLVAGAMSLDSVELFPGTLSVQTELLPCGSTPSTARLTVRKPNRRQGDAPVKEGQGQEAEAEEEAEEEKLDTLKEMMTGFAPRQAFRLSVHHMDATVLGEPVFKQGCRLDVQLLQGHSTTSELPQSHLDVTAPVVAMRLSQPQLDLLLDVIGTYVGAGGAAAANEAMASADGSCISVGASSVAAGVLGSANASAGGGLSSLATNFNSGNSLATLSSAGASAANPNATPTSTTMTTTPTTTNSASSAARHRASSGGAGVTTTVPSLVARPTNATTAAAASRAPSTGSTAAAPPSAKSVPTSLFSLSLQMGRLEADIGDVFRWSLRQTTVQTQSSPGDIRRKADDTNTGSSSSSSRLVAALEELTLQHAGSSVLALANNPASATAESAQAALNDVRDIIVVRHLMWDSVTRNSPPRPADDGKESPVIVASETETNVDADVFSLAISPASLFDARELLYLPFSSKVLHIPVDPIPILTLTEAVTKLDRDVVLDDKHILLTANRLRCSYVLDLQRHRLILTGSPSGQLVLYEGCEVTITNGTIVLPGLYTLGSFTSFAAQSALHTTSTCLVEKKAHGGPQASSQPLGTTTTTPPRPANGLGSGNSSPMYTRASSPAPSGAAVTAAATSARTLQQNRSLVSFRASLVRVCLLSDDVMDLTTSLESELVVKVAMDTENGVTRSRSIGIQFRQTVSGEHEPHVVLPTNLAIDMSGTDRLVVSVLLDSLEFCSRAALLASVVETMKDFGTAFLEEMTVTRVKPTVRLEDEQDHLLHNVIQAGNCSLCGRAGIAYLAKDGEATGTVCYECCTGLAALPSMEVRVEVPLVDAILLGERGDMLHLDIRRFIVNVAANMDVDVSLSASLFTLNNAAAVWEPCVENLVASMTGNITTNDYKFLVGRLNYVLSPINVTQLSVVMQEMTAPVLMQKRTRKAFRRMAAAKAPCQSYKGTRMYQEEIEEAIEDVRAGHATGAGAGAGGADEEELLLLPTPSNEDANLSMVNNFSMTARVAQRRGLNAFDLAQGFRRGRGERLPPLLAPGKRSASAEAVKAAQAAVQALTSTDAHPFAYVFVTNHLHCAIMFEEKRIDSRGGTARIMTSHASALVKPANVGADDSQGYIVDLANPILYAQAPGFFLETVVAIVRSEKDPHRLKRVVHVRVFPLHPTHTIVCIENKMSFPLDIRTSKATTATSLNDSDPNQAYKRPMTIQTGDRFFLDPHVLFEDPLIVEPNTSAPNATTSTTAATAGASDSKTVATAAADGGAEELDVLLPHGEFYMSSAPLIPNTPLAGTPVQLSWSSGKASSAGSRGSSNLPTVSATVSARQEAIRGGVPVYVLTVAPRFHVINKLPYPVSLNLLGSSATSVTLGGGAHAPHIEVGPRGRVGLTRLLLQHRLTTLDGARFSISVTQTDDDKSKKGDVYTTQTPFVAEGFADDSAGDNSSGSSGTEHTAKTHFLVLLTADKSRQFVVRLLISGPRLVLTTPFLLVNHTPLQLHLVECEPTGERKKRTGGRSSGSAGLNLSENTNYGVLPANMHSGIPACPAAASKEEFFVTVQTGAFQAKCIPLHVQQRGVIVMEEVVALSASSETAAAAAAKRKKKTTSSSAAKGTAEGGRGASRMVHLAYVSQLDEAGAIRVVITPRWVILNRCRFPLVVAASAYAGVNAQDANAAATAAVAIAHADSTTSSTVSTPTSQQQQVDDFKQALLRVQADDAENRCELPDNSTPHTVAPRSATPMLETPFCPPEVGFHLHILQDASAPLHGTPVDLETIHSEVVLAYNHSRNNPQHGVGERNDGGGAFGRFRDRFVEVSLIAQDPYTYVVLQEPETTPFLFLNRTPYYLEVLDTSPRSEGRLLARAAPGMGTELLMDPSVTTVTKVVARASASGDICLSSQFDFGRTMTTRERATAQTAGRLQYAIHYGAYGHCDVEVRLDDPAAATGKPNTTTTTTTGAAAAGGGGTATSTAATTTATTSGAAGPGANAAAATSSGAAPNTTGATGSSASGAAGAGTSGGAGGAPTGGPGAGPNATSASSAVAKGRPSAASPPAAARVHVQEPPRALSLLLNMTALTVSIALPNQDIVFAAVLDTRIAWARNGEREKTTFSVRNFQVDNQTEIEPRYDACVLALRKSESATALAGYVERIVVPAKRLLCFNEIKVDCSPIALRVSDLLLARLLRFSEALAGERDLQEQSFAAASIESANSSTATVIRSPDRATLQTARQRQDLAALRNPSHVDLYKRAPLQADFMTTRVMIERFIVNPLLIRFWLTRDVEEHDFFRENIHSREAALLSMMVATCEDVQVAAPGLACVKRVSRLGVFLQWVIKCYTDGLLAQLHGVVLQYASSLPLLGAPVKLFSGIGGGAVRLFKDPIEGLATSPSAFLTGLGSGSTGFVQGLAGGGLGAFSNLTDAGSRFLSMGSGTSERERQHQNTLTAFARGVQGIYQKPMEGHAESGAAGFLKGAVQGLVGVVTNPVSGMLSDVSKATGAISRLVNDTYIPKTQRMHDIREFHANGGIAPWGTVVTVYQYQRLEQRKQAWTGAALMSHVDGPEWFPCTREAATYDGAAIPEDRWVLDRHESTVEGWTFSLKYYGSYSSKLTRTVRVRRKHWTALVKPLPYSGVAAFLRVNPGMAAQPAGLHSRSASTDFAPGTSAATVVTFAPPGVLSACTVQEAKAARARTERQHKRRYHRTMRSGLRTTRTRSADFTDREEFEQKKGVRAKMRTWTAAGRHMGVRADELRSKSAQRDEDEDLPLTRLIASDFQLPSAPREEKKKHSRTPSRVTFLPDADDSASPDVASTLPRSASDTSKTRKHSRSRSGGGHETPRTGSSSAPVEPLSAEQTQASRRAPVITTQRTPSPPLVAYDSQPPTRRDTQKPSTSNAQSSPAPQGKQTSPKPAPAPTTTAAAAAAPTATTAMAVSPLRPTPVPARDVVTIYEYERKVALLGWGRRLMDCPAWQDAHGRETASREEQRPPQGWSWGSDWAIAGGNSKDGWETPVNGDRNLRRRCWQRVVIQK